MEVIVSVATSLDGYIDDSSTTRLKLSSPEDWGDVLDLRCGCDAILVGAGTLRADNPSLVVKSNEERQKRVVNGLSKDIVKVSVTSSGCVDKDMRFFTEGSGLKILFAKRGAETSLVQDLCEVIVLEDITAESIINELSSRGFKRLLVEGGSTILTMFFKENMVDKLRLAIAPFFVGDSASPRFVRDELFFANKDNRMNLINVRQLGDMAVMEYERER